MQSRSKRPITKFFLILLICLVSGCAQRNDQNLLNERRLVIVNANVIDVTSGAIAERQAVITKNGKIASILPMDKLALDGNFVIKNADGGYVIPGLVDMHVHAYDQSAFELSLSHGVTHVRVMNGTPDHLKWRDAQYKGSWLASGMSVSSPIVQSYSTSPLSWRADDAERARAIVHEAKELGYDLIKAYGSMNQESLTALLDESAKLGIPVAKHGPHPAKGMSWSDMKGIQSYEHVEDVFQGILNYKFDKEQLPQAIEKVKGLNSPITPTLNIFWQLTKISTEKQAYIDTLPTDYISPVIAFEEKSNQVKRWLNSSENHGKHNQRVMSLLSNITKLLKQANIPLLVGSDAGVLLSPHGLATINEMLLMNEAGINELGVLQAATINAAIALGKRKEFGQIKVGLNADMMIVSNNPLNNLSSLKEPTAVIKNGHWLAKSDLEKLRKSAIDKRDLLKEIMLLLKNY